MPELPEVEYGRRVAEAALAGRRLVRVRVPPEDDDKVFPEASGHDVAKTLSGRTVAAVHRRGKQLWVELDEAPHVLVHFGMTGAFRTPGDDPLPLEAGTSKPSADWPPRFWKLLLEGDDGSALAFTNARRLGRVVLREDPLAEKPLKGLGFDPLLDPPKFPEFQKRLARRKGVLKALLLDQSFAAGVGNWIADEVLYQAGLDPRRPVPSLTEEEAKRLLSKLKSVVKAAVKVDARKDRFPKTWLFHHRWGQKDDARTSRKEKIEHITVAGRTTAWVPSRQR